MEPATIALIATALAAAAQGGGAYYENQQIQKAGERRARETERETQAGLFNEAHNRGSELAAHGLASRGRLGRRKAHSMQETAELLRGAFNI